LVQHTHTHARTHARTHAHTHTHTHTHQEDSAFGKSILPSCKCHASCILSIQVCQSCTSAACRLQQPCQLHLSNLDFVILPAEHVCLTWLVCKAPEAHPGAAHATCHHPILHFARPVGQASCCMLWTGPAYEAAQLKGIPATSCQQTCPSYKCISSLLCRSPKGRVSCHAQQFES